jgi:hypothetical protein
MARIEDIERRLLNWARWKLGATRSGLGYAAVRWNGALVGSRNRESVIPTIDCEAEETDRAVQALESRLRATVEVVYLHDRGLRAQARRLCCSEPTVKARVWQAHRALSQWLAERASVARAEHERVQHLQVAAWPRACASA